MTKTRIDRGGGRPPADPEVRVSRAKAARAAQSSPDYFIRKLAAVAPDLNPRQRADLRNILAVPMREQLPLFGPSPIDD